MIALLTTANDIIDQLKDTSPDVLDLMRELKEPVSEYKRGVIEDLLKLEFQVALKGNVPAGMMTPLASLLAHNTVRDITVVLVVRGDSIVIYFLCPTLTALYDLLELITSGFMHSVFAEMINTQAPSPRTVHVYVKDQDFSARLSVLSSAQGLLFVRQLLILKLKGIFNVTLKLS